MSVVPYEEPVVRLNPYLERLLSFVHVLPPTAFTTIVEECITLERSMFHPCIDKNMEDMGIIRVHLNPDAQFEELVEHYKLLQFINASFFTTIDYNDYHYIEYTQYIENNIPMLTPIDHYVEFIAPPASLAVLANDAENIHTSSIQQDTARAIQILMRHSLHNHSYMEGLLISIRDVWFDSLTFPPPYWALVLEEPLCDEFQLDLLITSNFDTTYFDLLQSIWAYACEQSLETKSQIAIRLAEEVVDGEGMCPQGKMSRLVNVLRGFHPELDTIPAVSVQEQLQSRMAIISAMPHAERASAATAVFAELSISEALQAEWMDALLEA